MQYGNEEIIFIYLLIHFEKQFTERSSNIFNVCCLINKQEQKPIQASNFTHLYISTPYTIWSIFLWETYSYASIIPPSHSHVRDCNLIPEEPRFAPSCSSKLRPSPKSRDERGFWTSVVSLWIMVENKGLTNDPLACRSSRMMRVSGIMVPWIPIASFITTLFSQRYNFCTSTKLNK